LVKVVIALEEIEAIFFTFFKRKKLEVLQLFISLVETNKFERFLKLLLRQNKTVPSDKNSIKK
jgi:hypothetical protein|tara:strand:- start:1071 stop:1259 length:189 start_codon:yes stop_codon:yes gene_type:complete